MRENEPVGDSSGDVRDSTGRFLVEKSTGERHHERIGEDRPDRRAPRRLGRPDGPGRGRPRLPGRGRGEGHHAARRGSRCGATAPGTNAPSQGALDPLMAKAIVIAAGDDKVALVGIDLGRGPTDAMMKVIRKEVAEKAGIRHVLITGSHTHHGPVIELIDEPGLGKGKFDAAVAYSRKLPGPARRGDPRRRQGPQARQDRRRDRVGRPQPQPADQARAEGHRPDAGRHPVRRRGGQADRRPRQLRRAPGHDRREGAQVLGRLPGLPQEQGRGRAGDEVRLHAGGGRRHEHQRRRRARRAQGLRRDARRPRDRAGPVGRRPRPPRTLRSRAWSTRSTSRRAST